MSNARNKADMLAELAPFLPLARVVARWVYAGIALHGYLVGRNSSPDSSHSEFVSTGCVLYADSLIAELEKPRAEGGA